jgi:hypothetical protein
MRERKATKLAAGMAASIENIYPFYTLESIPFFIRSPVKTLEITKKSRTSTESSQTFTRMHASLKSHLRP